MDDDTPTVETRRPSRQRGLSLAAVCSFASSSLATVFMLAWFCVAEGVCAPTILGLSKRPMEGVLIGPGAVSAVAGCVLGIAALCDVVRGHGKVRGVWFAVGGIALSVMIALGIALVFALAVRPVSA